MNACFSGGSCLFVCGVEVWQAETLRQAWCLVFRCFWLVITAQHVPICQRWRPEGDKLPEIIPWILLSRQRFGCHRLLDACNVGLHAADGAWRKQNKIDQQCLKRQCPRVCVNVPMLTTEGAYKMRQFEILCKMILNHTVVQMHWASLEHFSTAAHWAQDQDALTLNVVMWLDQEVLYWTISLFVMMYISLQGHMKEGLNISLTTDFKSILVRLRKLNCMWMYIFYNELSKELEATVWKHTSSDVLSFYNLCHSQIKKTQKEKSSVVSSQWWKIVSFIGCGLKSVSSVIHVHCGDASAPRCSCEICAALCCRTASLPWHLHCFSLSPIMSHMRKVQTALHSVFLSLSMSLQPTPPPSQSI